MDRGDEEKIGAEMPEMDLGGEEEVGGEDGEELCVGAAQLAVTDSKLKARSFVRLKKIENVEDNTETVDTVLILFIFFIPII